ncbi:MAG: glycosyltransferase family 2 protein [Tessaracoccus sp.]|uniref:glycosyltransferase family 2 protein n=1 Tax=Tessaracoccus sp. TaxID=1971211 RepID=UPI001EBED31A|nr:glycosyltransferase family A protein [Tessaracoccus sp.]MBK7822446.1 glycosyltransferase family 2 protein [Tessaracoccus sp.]
MTAEHLGVSVVIPTVGRPELARAIASIEAQDYPGPVELIVVGDLPPGSLDDELVKGADQVLYTGGGRRAGAARNLGIAAARQELVAFLDDDDEWLPGKLSAQIPMFGDAEVAVVGTQIVYRNAGTDGTSSPVPSEVKKADQSVVEYLFVRRSPKVGRAVICTPTLVVRSEVARRVVWNETLRRHQDWDWVDRLEREGGARILQIADASSVIWTGSDGSISSSPDWESSLAWGMTRAGVWPPRVLADFIAGQPLRYACQARSARGVARTLRALLANGRFPSVQALALGASGVVPRSLINKLLSR